MRGFNLNPVLLLSSLKETKEKESEKVLSKQENEETEKPPVNLNAQDVVIHRNATIQPQTAWVFVTILLLFLVMVIVLDARSRVSRLEAIVFQMLAQQQQQQGRA